MSDQKHQLEKLIRSLDETIDGLGEWHDATEYLEWVRKEVQQILNATRPRVVETIDQLASLRDGTWIRDRAGDVGEKRDWPLDLAVHYPKLGHWKTNATIPVPALVLWTPEEA